MLDKYKIRDNNERTLLKQLMIHQPISRASLSKITKLNKSTVTEIVNRLMERHLVVEVGLGDSNTSGGRKPMMLRVNEASGYVIAIDLGNTYFKATLSDLNNAVVDYVLLENLKVGRDNTLTLIEDCVKHFEKITQRSQYGVVGMVVAVHGVVQDNHVTLSPNYNMRGLHLNEKLEARFDFPIYVENEANLAAMGHLQTNHEVENLIVLSIHTGIGGGVIINRELYRGHTGGGGELGHITLYPHGTSCQCSKEGCFEKYCSTHVILSRFEAAKKLKSVTIDDFVAAYNANDDDSIKILDTVLSDLAIGIGTIISAFDPEIFYIINEIMDQLPQLIDVLKEKVTLYTHQEVTIELSNMPHGATLYGAATLGISNFLDIDHQI